MNLDVAVSFVVCPRMTVAGGQLLTASREFDAVAVKNYSREQVEVVVMPNRFDVDLLADYAIFHHADLESHVAASFAAPLLAFVVVVVDPQQKSECMMCDSGFQKKRSFLAFHPAMKTVACHFVLEVICVCMPGYVPQLVRVPARDIISWIQAIV